MFEEYTEEYFVEQAREKGQKLGVDTREGSVYMDAAMGHCVRAAKFMNDLSTVFGMLAIDSCGGDILTERAAMDGVDRQLATPSYWNVTFEGTTPDTGTRMFVNSYYFKVVYVDETYLLESEIKGIETNYLEPGSAVVPVNNVDGLTSCVLGQIYSPGANDEEDSSLKERWKEKKAGPSQGGNKSQYKSWCEECTGVGRARILPLYGGENTIKGVIYSTEGEIPSTTILDSVQEYIDPLITGYTVTVNGKQVTFGDGLGDGVGFMGAHFLAAAPEKVEISITVSVDLKSGYTKSQVQSNVLQSVKAYAKQLVLEGEENVTIKASSIGSIIAGTEGVLDYSLPSLLLNGSSNNINIGEEQAPVIKEVSFND